MIKQHKNFIVLSGCSGGGKSSVLKELAKQGFKVHPEPCLEVLKEQESLYREQKSLHLHNRKLFFEHVLSRCLNNFNDKNNQEKIVFFDRSLIDVVHAQKNNLHFESVAQKFRYNKKIFFFPPWEEIYKQDNYRKHDFNQASKDYRRLKDNYLRFGYELIDIAKNSIEDRVNFILSLTNPPF